MPCTSCVYIPHIATTHNTSHHTHTHTRTAHTLCLLTLAIKRRKKNKRKINESDRRVWRANCVYVLVLYKFFPLNRNVKSRDPDFRVFKQRLPGIRIMRIRSVDASKKSTFFGSFLMSHQNLPQAPSQQRNHFLGRNPRCEWNIRMWMRAIVVFLLYFGGLSNFSRQMTENPNQYAMRFNAAPPEQVCVCVCASAPWVNANVCILCVQQQPTRKVRDVILNAASGFI